MIARCSCGKVEYELAGAPIVSLICYCDDCQAGSRPFGAQDSDGGTPYVVYRKDRVRCRRGEELLVRHKLQDRSRTSRVVATCCGAPMVMWFDDAKHWTPVFRARLSTDAPNPELRICTKFAPDSVATDLPTYPGYPFKLVAKLLRARLAMLLNL